MYGHFLNLSVIIVSSKESMVILYLFKYNPWLKYLVTYLLKPESTDPGVVVHS